MTNDELLAKIDIWKFKTIGFDDTYEVHGILNALRMVVELHIEILDPVGRPECLSCRRHYPCPTFQALEKELA